MDDFGLPDDLNDVEIIYSDGENEEDDQIEEIPQTDEIEEPIEDKAFVTFWKHTWEVFTGDVTKNGEIAITGGQDDIAYMWSISSSEVLLECTGHKDSVTDVSFNHDNQLVVTGDMNGMLQVWNVKERKLEWCYEGDDMTWLKWHPSANILICGCNTGDVYIWQVPQGNCKVLPAHSSFSTSCGTVLPNGKQLLAGYDDGQLKLWNIKERTVAWTHTQSKTVTNLDVNSEGSLCIVAPMGHIVKMGDGKNVFTLPVEESLECVRFYNEYNYLATGSLDGDLCVYDLSKQSLRNQVKCRGSITVMELGKDGKLFVADNTGVVLVWDVKSGVLLQTLTGHKDAILCIKVFNEGNSILTTSSDNTAKVFHLQ